MTDELFYYSAFGLSIASELPLPELPLNSGDDPDVWIRLGSVPFTPKKWSISEHFIFNTLSGAFRITKGREIVVEPLQDADARSVRVLLLGKVMACLVFQRGWLPLHASGVTIGGNAALFLGPSGVGKSTLAAALFTRGHTVITDDVAPVRVTGRKCEALPAWSRLRLSPESLPLMDGHQLEKVFHTDKYDLNLGRLTLLPIAQVRRIYVLDFSDNFKVNSLMPLEAAASMNMYSFVKLHRCNREALQLHLQNCAAVAETTVVHQLSRPRVFAGLPVVARFIERDMETDDECHQ